jgi:hypothetical protein
MVFRQEFNVRSFSYMLILFVCSGITSSAFCNNARDNVETMTILQECATITTFITQTLSVGAD